MAAKNAISDDTRATISEKKNFFSNLHKMEDMATEEDQNRKKNEVTQDWENDIRDPMEQLMVTKDRPLSTPSYREDTNSPFPGRGKRRPNFRQGRWNNNRRKRGNNEFQGPPSSYYSTRSSSSIDDISQRFRPRSRPFRGRGRWNPMNYYESDMESVGNFSSLDTFTSISSQETSASVSVSPYQLARSLIEFPNYQTTLLTLLDECQYDHKQVRQVVVKYPETLEIEGEMVRLRPKVGICRRHLDTDGCPVPQTCNDLHICLKYLNGQCRDKDCVFGHVLHTNHNKPILDNFHLIHIPVKIIFGLFKSFVVSSGDTAEKLEVCEAYNANDCSDEQCQKLHLCIKLLAKCCLVDSGCQLNHKVFSKQPSSILESHGVSLNESLRDILIQISSSPLIKKEVEALKAESVQPPTTQTKTVGGKAASEKVATPSSSPVATASGGEEKVVPVKTIWSHEFNGEVTLNEICYDSVEGFCPYEESGCWRLHCDFHFHWQVRSTTKDKKLFWINLTKEQALALETAFCDAGIDKTPLPTLDATTLIRPAKGLRVALGGRSKWVADFVSMQLTPAKENKNTPLELRRLFTEDYANKPAIPDACVFQWFFLDKNQQWIEYGNTDSTGEAKLKCNISSKDIAKYLSQNGDDSVMQFENQSFTYLLDFQNMIQTNLKTNVSRKVRRRPQPHLKEEQSVVEASKSDLPITWDPMPPEERVRRVVLSPSSSEYQNVMTHIQNNGGGGINVLTIERVQTPYSWRAFQNKVQEMTSLYKDATTVNVRQLFHGTNPDIVPKICEENFDWRLHGSNAGQAHGRGTYFSPFASTSHGYTSPDTAGNRFMFIARVAVGTMTAGDSSMTRPPINPQYNVPFDATVNATQTPSIIVKYDKQEYFPEYILTMT